MRHALMLLALVAATSLAANRFLGYAVAYAVGYGAIVIMAAMISATFFWLWRARATPLALGMGFSWAGAASVLGWWWVYNLANRPAAMAENGALFLFLSLYFVGAILHFFVIQRSLGLGAAAFALPVAGAFVASALIVIAAI